MSLDYYGIYLNWRDLQIRRRWKLAKTQTTHEVMARLDA